ncbi:MAG: sulfite exporter TauE/SafE family protein [Planctomycetes bacterium]|nr:sulfite exporter TauE/SafE family protein [Planctomycetota bacterium]
MSEAPQPSYRPTFWSLAAWLAAAFLSTLSGIGGGTFAVPILHYLVRLPFQMAIGTSLVVVFSMTLVATIVEFLQADSALDWTVVGLLVAGGLPGAQLGYWIGKRIDTRTLKALFVLLLVAAAIRISSLHGGGEERAAAGVALSATKVLWILLIGVGGGILAPLLGIGGGLLVIPALFLTLSDMSYLEARACSLAMSVVNSVQAAYLHLRDGTAHVPTALPFTGIALIGAVLGVWAVHRPGWGEVARVVLVVVLVLMAARLTWDVWRARAEKRV